MSYKLLTRVARKTRAAPGRLPGAAAVARRLRASATPVVMYHGVTAAPPAVFNWCQLACESFQQQMEFLAQEYVVTPLAEIVARLRSGAPLPRRAACVTFDDGFRNVLTTAHPILARLQIPATVFLVTGLVGSARSAWPEQLYASLSATSLASIAMDGRRWLLSTRQERAAAYASLTEILKTLPEEEKDRRLESLLASMAGPPAPTCNSPLALLDWSDVDELAAGGLVQFGSHTHTHPILSRCSAERQREELTRSRALLLERLGRADLFAYPNGGREDFTSLTRRLTAEAGYRGAVTTLEGLNCAGGDVYQMPRVHVGADTSLRDFELRMAGF
ncbi:MAG: polysaccharide deacetylase family protein [Planctomycetes bacterium]|nr:polysaccharide deacetylase family protein [Planctomycetota bacterium]